MTSARTHTDTHTHTYIYIYIYIYIYTQPYQKGAVKNDKYTTHTHTHTERERERETVKNTFSLQRFNCTKLASEYDDIIPLNRVVPNRIITGCYCTWLIVWWRPQTGLCRVYWWWYMFVTCTWCTGERAAGCERRTSICRHQAALCQYGDNVAALLTIRQVKLYYMSSLFVCLSLLGCVSCVCSISKVLDLWAICWVLSWKIFYSMRLWHTFIYA